MSDTTRPFHLVYSLAAHPEGILPADVPEDSGACDQAIVINATEDSGTLSLCTVSLDGHTGKPLPPRLLFHYWLALSAGFSKNPALAPIDRDLAWAIANEVTTHGELDANLSKAKKAIRQTPKKPR